MVARMKMGSRRLLLLLLRRRLLLMVGLLGGGAGWVLVVVGVGVEVWAGIGGVGKVHVLYTESCEYHFVSFHNQAAE
jgi:hypothetical protein